MSHKEEAAAELRLVLMAHGAPFDPRTNSGVASHLFPALASQLDVVGTVSSAPSNLAQNLARLRSFAPTKSAWRSRYRMSMEQVHSALSTAKRNLSALELRDYDAFFQIGTYCDVSRLVDQPIFAYLDHDLPALIRLDPRMRQTSMSARYVRRRIASEKRALESASRIFTFSEWCGRQIAEDYDIPPQCIQSVGAGSNIPETYLAGEPDYDACHAMFIGFDFERKGGPQVLRAFASVRSQLPAARLTIVGSLPPGEPAPGVISTGRIVGSNSKQRIAELLASSSLYVMPSVFEPFGIAFLEAMAAGLPCIGGISCAMPEIIGDTGAIVDPGDTDELARVMYELMSDPKECQQRGRAARMRYKENYGWDKVATKIKEGIEASLNSPIKSLLARRS